MEQQPRPFMHYRWWDLKAHAEKHWDDPAALEELLFELNFRTMKHSSELREDVTLRLVEISNEFFIYPTSDAPPSATALDPKAFQHEESPLKAMGYTVGQRGARVSERRRILDLAYLGPIPRVQSAAYMAGWGQPKTAKRLKKMADFLAANARNFHRNDANRFRLAIRHWTEDLEYLRIAYYVGRYDFTWPQT